MKESYKILFCLCVASLLFAACKSKQATNDISSLTPVGPAFVADSAFAFCQAQCDFGPRTMNSEAHDRCAQWTRPVCPVDSEEIPAIWLPDHAPGSHADRLRRHFAESHQHHCQLQSCGPPQSPPRGEVPIRFSLSPFGGVGGGWSYTALCPLGQPSLGR